MNYIFLDASNRETFGQAGTTESFKSFSWKTNKNLSSRLTTLCDEMLQEAGFAKHSIDVFAVCTGPGSLTGLRTAAAFMRASALVTGKSVIGIDLFSWAAATLSNAGKKGAITLLVPALLHRAFFVDAVLPFEQGARIPKPDPHDGGSGPPAPGWRASGGPDPHDGGSGPPATGSGAFSEARRILGGPGLRDLDRCETFPSGYAIRFDHAGITRIDPSPAALHDLIQSEAMLESTRRNNIESILRVLPLYVVPSQAEINLEKKNC